MHAKDKKDITQEQLNSKAKEAGFTGQPLIVEKWQNVNFKLTGKQDEDIARGALAIKIGDTWQKSPAVGDIYFANNFKKIG